MRSKVARMHVKAGAAGFKAGLVDSVGYMRTDVC